MASQAAANLESLTDLCTPWCIHVVTTLRIAEHIQAGTTRIEELAKAADCDEYVLHSILGHLVSKGVFLETPQGTFALNEPARKLLEPSWRLGLDLDGLGGRLAGVWSTMLKYVRTGEPAYKDVFGLPFWEDLNAHPSLAAEFDALIGPAGHGTPKGEFEITGGWESVRNVVDVAGGTGAMLAEVLRLHRHLTGTLVDLPRTVALATDNFRAAGVEDRVKTSGQSFFDPLPTGSDIYYLRGIINDWPDRESIEILRRCREAAQPNGRVVVLGGVGPDTRPMILTIEMILVGGKQRKLSEFERLAHAAGLSITAAARQSSGYFVVECAPAG